MTDFEDGQYLTFSYNNSIRFRINEVRNGDAAISAIFFD